MPLEAFLWGDWQSNALGGQSVSRPAGLGVVGKLRRRRHLTAEEFAYLRARAKKIPKVTLTSPGLYANLWSPEVSRRAYPTLDEFLADPASVVPGNAMRYPGVTDPTIRKAIIDFLESRTR